MRVRISRPCHVYGIPRALGELIDVEADLGARLCAAGYATPSRGDEIEVETAESAAHELAERADYPYATPKQRRRGGRGR